jgi:DNA repair exonuclease SbcCD ATPase subunit
MIVDVRCSSNFSNAEDSQGSESTKKLQSLRKTKKQIESQIEMLSSKEGVLKDVLVAYASNASFDFGGGLDRYDEKKLEVRVKREELEEELAALEKKIREVGADYVPKYGITGSNILLLMAN